MSCAVKMQRENQITVSHITQNKQKFNTFKNRSEMFPHFCGKRCIQKICFQNFTNVFGITRYHH